jgi:glycosyltransferase involved in cell wall biosynthesis
MLDHHAADVRFVIWHHQHFRLVPAAKVAELVADPDDAPHAPAPVHQPAPPPAPLAGWPLFRRKFGAALVRLDRATTLHLWRAGRRVVRLVVPPAPPPSYLDAYPICRLQPGDIYVNCAMILEEKHRGAVEKAHACGVKVVIFGYDIIAALFPEYYAPRLGGLLNDCFHRMIRLADFIPCISRCTECDFVAFAQRQGVAVATGVVELGCDGVATTTPDHGGHPVLSQLPEWGFVAIVGTFEIRKNHRLILQVWEELGRVTGLELPPLIIAGQRGWCVDDIIAGMEQLPQYGKKIFWFPSLSDRQIAWLFKHCAFSVYPSLYEGWGLPVAECLSFGRPVLCSNASSLPEVAKGLATLLDPHDPAAWTNAVRRAIYDYAGRPVSINYPRQTWEQTGEQLYRMIKQFGAESAAGTGVGSRRAS